MSPATLKPTFALVSDFLDILNNGDEDGLNAKAQRNLDAWNTPNVRGLLAQRNYTLDNLKEEGVDDPERSSNPLQQPTVQIAEGESALDIDPYPFIYQPTPVARIAVVGIFTAVTMGGKDHQGRHIVVKAFDSKGDEGAIYRHLYKEGPSVLRENCMLPILDIIDFDDKVSFAVTPKWNSEVSARSAISVGDVSLFIHSLLKGMAYMHRNRIVHRDIRETNYVLNYGQLFHTLGPHGPVLCQLRKERKLRVAYIDFDQSKMYPRETDLATPRLPWWYAITNDYGQPTPELEQGELEYNPFPLEVARLGYHFLEHFRSTLLIVPSLVPLISMMIDWDLSRRFTAQQALEFYEEHCLQPMNELWDKDCYRSRLDGDPKKPATREEFFDPWHMATPCVKKQWASYQPRPMPLFRRLLRQICQRESGLRMIRRLRSFWDKLCKLRLSKTSINITI